MHSIAGFSSSIAQVSIVFRKTKQQDNIEQEAKPGEVVLRTTMRPLEREECLSKIPELIVFIDLIKTRKSVSK